MRTKTKEPAVPVERYDTVRREIIYLLEGRMLSAKDISVNIGISIREVYEHLDHIQKTLNVKSRRLFVTPAECKKCGFIFRKRERLRRPGKCPVCRSESIEEPLFSSGTAGRGAEEGGNR